MDFTLTEGGSGATQALLRAHNNDTKVTSMQVVSLMDDAIVERDDELEMHGADGAHFLLVVDGQTFSGWCSKAT